MKNVLAAVFCLLLLPTPLAHACGVPDWSVCGTDLGCTEGCGTSAGADLVSVSVVDATADEVSRVLSAVNDTPIVFSAANPDDRFSLTATGVPVSELLQALGRYGAVVEQSEAPMATSVPEANVTMMLESVPASEVARLLNVFFRGSDFALEAAAPDRRVTLEVKAMPLREIVPLLARVAAVNLRRL